MSWRAEQRPLAPAKVLDRGAGVSPAGESLGWLLAATGPLNNKKLTFSFVLKVFGVLGD